MLFLLTITAILGCGPSNAVPVPRLVVADQVRIEGAVLGAEDEAITSLLVHNTGTIGTWVTGEIDPPFRLPAEEIWVRAARSAPMLVAYRPGGYEAVTGTLTVENPELQWLEVEVQATTATDADQDGYTASGAGGDDCDDDQAEVHPGVDEVCNNVDDDCDGSVDEDAVDVRTWYRDEDSDGWGTAQDTLVQCFLPEGYTSRAGDCLDTNDSVHPEADDECYDGVDADCDHWNDYDCDRDGFVSDAYGGDDCLDRLKEAHPGALEIWYDGFDQGCDGGSDWDQDGDGYDSDLWGGADCDDTDAGRAPRVAELEDGVDQDCDDRVDEDFVLSGDLVVTEIFVDPDALDDEDGQYVEIANLSSRDVYLDALAVDIDGGTVYLEPSILLAGEVGLVCADPSPADNGGLSCVGELPALLQEVDSVSIGLGTLLDEVDWSGWAVTTGAAWELDAASLDPVANDAPDAWCVAGSDYGTGDLGSPGDIDSHCP